MKLLHYWINQIVVKGDIEAKYVGKKIPDEFVVGYGLDYEHYRNLPYIGTLKPEIYNK